MVDASVAVKWFLPEPASDRADALRNHPDPLVAPDLILLEVGNVLIRATRRGDLPLANAEEVMAKLAAGPVRLTRSTEFLTEALAIAGRHGGTLYDAVYVAVAQSLDAALVTDDRDMAAVARAAEVRTLPLAEGLPFDL